MWCKDGKATKEGKVMKKVIFAIVLSCMLLTGCDLEGDRIIIEGKTDNTSDDSIIHLKKGWFVEEYSIDYENKQIIFHIEEERE